MCGIAAVISLNRAPLEDADRRIKVMNDLLAHRGPDGAGIWVSPDRTIALGHRRLAIIGIDDRGSQPMAGPDTQLTCNGEIYNYRELRHELGSHGFETDSDSETIIHGYQRWGGDVVQHLRGMFAFALWDERRHELFCARDRFGIKPLYYAVVGSVLYIASEAKALLPFLDSVATEPAALLDYLTFQFPLAGKTLFAGIHEVPPAHTLTVRDGEVRIERYWEVHYDRDFEHTDQHFRTKVDELLAESIELHLRSDVPIGAYVSGGFDSSLIASRAAASLGGDANVGMRGFVGRFLDPAGYDESGFAHAAADHAGFGLDVVELGVRNFIDDLSDVIYHLDYPVAGPGSLPQYAVSRHAAKHRKVVLGGQGGDEIFGGYTRYLIAYFERVINGAIEGTLSDGEFVVTYESIIPNLRSLKAYKPLLARFWEGNLFGDPADRYLDLIDRSGSMPIPQHLSADGYSARATALQLFRADNVASGSYFDSMTHFDFKTLLPALLQVEDRMSMAHGLESRVPFLDHPLVESMAGVPSDIKFKNGELKRLLRGSQSSYLPPAVTDRSDKMGFPVPLAHWASGEGKDFIMDTLAACRRGDRDFVEPLVVEQLLRSASPFGRELWAVLSLELWHQRFHDRGQYYRDLLPAV